MKAVGIYFCLIVSVCLKGTYLFAEGSRELSMNGGYRAFLVSSTITSLSYPFPTQGTLKVYAKVGETIFTGSSAQGFGAGKINLRAPNGDIYTSGNSLSIGLIANRSQELAGPLPNVGGYTPFTQTVLPGQEGIWEIDFISQSNGGATAPNPIPILASSNWIQSTGQYIPAFDVSVRNTTNTAFLSGRVYTTVFIGILGTFDVGFNGIFKVLTKDGYLYDFDNNGQAGNGFSFFANNKGFRNATGTPSYKSSNNLNNPTIQDPRIADTQSDVTHKLFFNTPSSDMPSAAKTLVGTTWLLTSPSIPVLSNVYFGRKNGTLGVGGTNPLGGDIIFNASQNGTYTLSIDINRNGGFTDAIDRKLTGIVDGGQNTVFWDGLDGLGNKVSITGSNPLNINIYVVLYGGEVHFPFFDVERNFNGVKLTRKNGMYSPDNTIYWDDSPIQSFGTSSNPIVNLTGQNSLTNGHKWGTQGASSVDFGDEKGLDTWAFIAETPLVATTSVILKEADLEVVSLNAQYNCNNSQVTYTAIVKNNGPDDVSASQVSFQLPAELHNLQVSSSSTLGVSTITSATTNQGVYNAGLAISNGATRTFVFIADIPSSALGLNVLATVSIMRPAAITDPDATDPNSAVPTDAVLECNAAPSGVGCNNVINLSLALPINGNAGSDQTIKQQVTATLLAIGNGIWSQVGNFPSPAIISNPPLSQITVTGLTTIGKYSFRFTDSNGCSDTVDLNVISSIDPFTVVPNIFTPNGDGNNDLFEILGLSEFPGSQLVILNRWGNEVFRSPSYKNDWDGSGLAEGTYFYVFDRREPSGSFTSFKGWIYIKR